MIKSVYIHIPFCDNICSYCDFCKLLSLDMWIDKYLDSLESEIKEKYEGESINTLYIGGGTPSSLSINHLNRLFNIINIFNKDKDIEFTFECNIENITEEKLELLYKNGVNRLSIGIQTFNKKYLKFLNRNHTNEEILNKISLAKKIGFSNINIDLIYALPNQTLEDLNVDISDFFKLDINHISTYSLQIEPNTSLYIKGIKNIDEDLDYEMYNLICNTLEKNNYKHYEISNFSKDGYQSKHNLVYWNNLEYYGFGLGASGYIKGIRYDNTRSLNRYLKGNYLLEENRLTDIEKLQNEFILGFRKINGINKKEFKLKYNKDIKDLKIINDLLNEKKLLEDKENIYINPIYMYTSNNILINFIDYDF